MEILLLIAVILIMFCGSRLEMWDDMDSCDSSPISSIVIDNNCIDGKILLNNY